MNYIAGLIFFLFLGFIFLYLPITLYLSIREDRRILAKAEVINKKWLEDQLKLPMYRILVFIKNSDCPNLTKYFEPMIGKPIKYFSSDEIDFN